MVKFIRKISFFFPLGLVLIVFNYQVDPAHLFDSSFYREVANEFHKGNDVVGISNFDGRRLQKEIIFTRMNTPEVICICSSRCLEINEKIFQGKDFFNHSVTGGDLFDLVGVIGCYNSIHRMPKEVIIGLDQYFFGSKSEKWYPFKNEVNDVLNILGLYSIYNQVKPPMFYAVTSKYGQLISFTYFQNSITNLNSRKIEFVKLSNPEECAFSAKLHDGSRWYPIEKRTMSEMAINRKVVEQFPIEKERLLKEEVKFKKNVFESVLAYLLQRKIKVSIFISPYHPMLYNKIENDEVLRSKLYYFEAYCKNLSKRLNIKIIGSSDPHLLGLNSEDFYDAIHLRRVKINELFLNIN